MKKLFPLLLSLIFICSVPTTVFASSNDSPNNDLQILASMQERESSALQYISEHKEEILAEIETNKQNEPSVSPYNVSYGGFRYLDGDVLITKSTSSSGLTGHAGIIVGTKVLHIHPSYNNGNPELISLSTWYSRFPETITVRYAIGRTIPNDAGDYGDEFYVNGAGADNTYSLTSSITSTTKDYCSSLVWKCYYRGADFEFLVFTDTVSGGSYTRPSYIIPYDFITYREYNDFAIVNSVDWEW